MLFARVSGTLARDRRAVSVDRHDFRTEASRHVQPVNAFLEERIAAGHALVVAPVAGRFQSLRDRREVREDHVADRAVGEQRAQHDRERLVVIVLAHEHHALRLVARIDRRTVVIDAQKRRFFDQHVLARAQRAQREVEMKRRRHGHDDRVDARIVDRRGVVGVAPRALVPPAVVLGPGAVAARIAADDLRFEAFQMAAVHLRDEPAAEKGEVERRPAFARIVTVPLTRD